MCSSIDIYKGLILFDDLGTLDDCYLYARCINRQWVQGPVIVHPFPYAVHEQARAQS